MKFSKSELEIKDLLTKAIAENAIRKLEWIPECGQFVAATKAKFLAERDNSIHNRLARQRHRNRLCWVMTCQERNGSARKPVT